MSRFLNSLVGSFARTRTTRKARTALPHQSFEPLEGRMLMQGTPLPDGVSFLNGTININCGGADDAAAVVVQGDQLRVTLAHTVYVQVDINTVSKFTIHDADKLYSAAAVTKINFYGNDGNDSFTNGTAIRCTAVGGTGADSLTGGSADDILSGGDDDDTVSGRGGNDDLRGGLGDDGLEGGTGSDSLDGADGNDRFIFAGRFLGADTVTEPANVGQDTLDFRDFGRVASRARVASAFSSLQLVKGINLDLNSTAAQVLITRESSVKLSSGSGIEEVYGTDAADTIKGNARNNRIFAQGGNDKVDAMGGNDVVWGGAGKDVIDGGPDNDTLYGDAGDDVIHGGQYTIGDDWIYGGADNDSLFGDYGVTHLSGDSGNDRLFASPSDKSWLNGGVGDDTLVSVGGSAADNLTGGDGFDSFWMDSESSETVTDLSSTEQSADHVHRVSGFYSCTIDYGNGNVQDLGAPGRSRNGMVLADPLKEPTDNGVLTSFAKKPLFAPAGPNVDDIDQGSVGDCYFMAALSAIAKTNPDKIRQTVADLGDGTYVVNFHKLGIFGIDFDKYVRVDADLWANGNTPVYAGLGTGGSIWGPIVEKAWAFYHNNQGTYASINGGNSPGIKTDEALHAPAQSVANTGLFGNWFLKPADYLSAMRAQLLAGKAVTVGGPAPLLPSTPMVQSDDLSVSTFHRGAHVYTLISVASDLSSVVLRNPWASDGGGSDANPNDGYVTIPANVLFFCSGGFAAYSV